MLAGGRTDRSVITRSWLDAHCGADAWLATVGCTGKITLGAADIRRCTWDPTDLSPELGPTHGSDEPDAGRRRRGDFGDSAGIMSAACPGPRIGG